MTILELETRQGDGFVQVMLSGELDMSTVEKVEEELRRIDDQVETLLVLDLSRLSFLDSTGLRLMVTTDEQARKASRRLVIVKGPEAVQRVFSITKLDEKLEMVNDISDLS